MKKIKIFLVLLLMIIPTLVYAVPEKPPGDKPENKPPENNNVNPSYNGKTVFTEDTTESDKEYTTTEDTTNALLVSGGTSTINNCTITKSGSENSEIADFYGTNAAVLTYSNAILNINKCEINTNGTYANGVFAYGNGRININNSQIMTTANNSGGLMVTGGGILNANNCIVKTTGNSSAAIRSDRGGGTLTVNGGTYETNGMGSPAVYSTASIIVNNASLTSTSAEGLVVEGANSITLNNVKVTDTNNTLNGNSETYKNIFLYQSMSGDAKEGTATFTANNSTFTTNKGDTIFITNTTAIINLENNSFINNDGNFLRIQKGKWGNSGSNGGNVTLNMKNQKVTGNIIVDDISTLDINMDGNSLLLGSINNQNNAKQINLAISSDSTLSLTNDTYVTSLTNGIANNTNIYSNGKYKLYVNGEEITINQETYKYQSETTNNEITLPSPKAKNNYVYYIVIFILIILLLGRIIISKKKVRHKSNI